MFSYLFEPVNELTLIYKLLLGITCDTECNHIDFLSLSRDNELGYLSYKLKAAYVTL